MGILGWLRRMFRSRKHPRFFASKGTFVVVKRHTSHGKEMQKIQILDISEGGCAFIYNGTKKELEEAGFLFFEGGRRRHEARTERFRAGGREPLSDYAAGVRFGDRQVPSAFPPPIL